MEGNESTERNPNKARGGKRTTYPEYDDNERSVLCGKLLGDSWHDLGYLGDFWNVVHDESDLEQYRRMAGCWQLMHKGQSYPQIAQALSVHERKARAYVRGDNCRPNLAQMYLIREKLGRPRDGWKWILDCTPKPTNVYPKATQIPEQIRDYSDILEFLKQFPRIPDSNPNLSFFGVDGEWVEKHKPELFIFLVAFLVGDGGKYYSEYESRARHYRKAAMTTNMKRTASNYRVLRYVQLCLDCIGIRSDEIEAHQLPNGYEVIRWNSVYNNVIAWIIRVCMGLKEGERTSQNPIRMGWLFDSPHEFIVAFFQGLADSDGHVDKFGYYADISSKPNWEFYTRLFKRVQIEAKPYPTTRPKLVRILLQNALKLPLFSPIVRSYRHEQLLQHATRRQLIPPPPSFFT